MKRLVFIHGPNGVGKSTTCKLLHEKTQGSAWVESEWARRINPFTFTEEIERMTENNLTQLLRSYLELSVVETVFFNWGLYGPREKIFKRVMRNISDMEYQYIPILITCSERENINRMKLDQRSDLRISRGIKIRNLYENPECNVIDSTDLTPMEVADYVLELLERL
jgi:adenylate kinase family enzyme